MDDDFDEKPAPSSGGTTIIEENSKNSLLTSLIIYVVGSLILNFLVDAVLFRLNHKIEFDWWKSPPVTDVNGAKKRMSGSNYEKRFDFGATLGYKYGFSFYFIYTLMSPPSSYLDFNSVEFIYRKLWPQRLVIDPMTKKQVGVVTPKSLAETVLLIPGDGIDAVDDWFAAKSNITRHKPVFKGDNTPDGPAQTQILTTNAQYKFKAKPDSGNNDWYWSKQGNTKQSYTVQNYYRVGVEDGDDCYAQLYPSNPNDLESWKAVIEDWLNVDAEGNDWRNDPENGGIWCWWGADSESGAEEPSFVKSGQNPHDPGKNWYSRPDNPFGKLGIDVKSSLFIDFFSHHYSSQALVNNIAAFPDLVGDPQTQIGGWSAYLRGNTSKDVDDLINYLYSVKNVTMLKPVPCQKPDIGGAVLTGASSALGTCGMAAMLPFPANAIGVVAGLAVGIAQGATSAGGTC